ncbi:hypothetical protein EKO04_009868 [Ascochyta lentis]|uniref:Dynein light chain n=1 Tax=Ascochyta lentis TaxID=205686 RepID=A0A8H7MDG4_9PLEO|nr:hypothetical protein EKO04_009868 [Ascochyta lentis]
MGGSCCLALARDGYHYNTSHNQALQQTQSLAQTLAYNRNPHPNPRKYPQHLKVYTMASEKSDLVKQEAQIKSADMSEEMQNEAIEVAQQAMEQFTIEKDIAQFIKKEFDNRKGATWHCIVGRNFGSFVTHETKHFIYFYLGHCAILLFKTQ